MCENHISIEVEETAELPTDLLPENLLPIEPQAAQMTAAASEARSAYAEIIMAKMDALATEIKQIRPLLSEGDLQAIRSKLTQTIDVTKETLVTETTAPKTPQSSKAKTKDTRGRRSKFSDAQMKEALKREDYSVKAVAEALGVTRATIYNRAKKCGIKIQDQRTGKIKSVKPT